MKVTCTAQRGRPIHGSIFRMSDILSDSTVALSKQNINLSQHPPFFLCSKPTSNDMIPYTREWYIGILNMDIFRNWWMIFAFVLVGLFIVFVVTIAIFVIVKQKNKKKEQVGTRQSDRGKILLYSALHFYAPNF